MKAWPFLFSKAPAADFVPVSIPKFITQGGAGRELGYACDNIEHRASEAVHMKCFHPGTGPFDVVFRVVTGRQHMLDGMGSQEVLRDHVGRAIPLIEGFVIQGRLSDHELRFTKAQLDAAHHEVEQAFRRLHKTGQEPPRPTDAMDLPPAVGEPLHLLPHESRTVQEMSQTPAPASTGPDIAATHSAKSIRPPLAEKTPKLPSPKPTKLPPRCNSNKTLMFCLVTGVALGAAYVTCRYFSKPNPKSEDFAPRIRHARSAQSPSEPIR